MKINNQVQKPLKKILISELTENQKTEKPQSIKAESLMKLSVITQFFPPDYAATGQLIDELVRHLELLGVQVEVFTSQPGYAFATSNAPAVETEGQIRIRRSRSAQLWFGRIRGKAFSGVLFTLRAALHLIKSCRSHNVFLLTSAPPFLPVIGYLANLCFKISYVSLVYDLYPDIAVALDVIPQHHPIARFWQAVNKRVWRRAKGIVVLSPAMKERIIGICPEVADKISVIHSWGDANTIVPIPKEDNFFARKYNLIDKFTVLYSGNMGRCHDMDTILQAAKELQNEPIQFVFVGDGAKREQMVQQVQQLNLDNCMFLPYQEKHMLPYSLVACDVSLVSVEAGFESLVAPSKLYPALATGRPVAVICPQHSYLNQLISDANCGATFENKDSSGLAKFIRKLNEDKQLAEKMGRVARQYMQSHFTPEVISKEYLEVLRRATLQ